MAASTSSPIKVIVHGAAGRVGAEVVRAVHGASGMTLAGAVDRIAQADVPPLPDGVPYYTDVRQALEHASPDVIVDFSVASASLPMLPIAIGAGARPVIGTTGFSDEQVEYIDALCREHKLGGVLAPNFAIGAVLLTKLAAIAAPYFDYADIAEEHHEAKIDAPSGTALGLARALHEAHPERFSRNEPEREPLAGTRGGDYEGITIHSGRMPGRMAHHQVTFGGPGQTLTLRHDTIDRQCYMPGVLLAIRKVGELEGLTVGLDVLMGI